MNLHQIVRGAIRRINPDTMLRIQVSDGYDTMIDGTQVPKYCDPVTVPGDVQALNAGEIAHLDSLNIQGRAMKFYINGNIDGLIRPNSSGGELITIVQGGTNQQLLGSVWLVKEVMEYWPDWCAVSAILQDDACYPSNPDIP